MRQDLLRSSPSSMSPDSLAGRPSRSWTRLKLAFRVLLEAAHPDVADAVTVHGVLLNPDCQEELFNPGPDVSINPNYNPILTPQGTVPDVGLGFTSIRHLQIRRISLAYDFFRFVR